MTERDTLVERLRWKEPTDFFARAYQAALEGRADQTQQKALASYVAVAQGMKHEAAAEIERLSSVRGDVVAECAKVAENMGDRYAPPHQAGWLTQSVHKRNAAVEIAAAIRALAGPDGAEGEG